MFDDIQYSMVPRYLCSIKYRGHECCLMATHVPCMYHILGTQYNNSNAPRAVIEIMRCDRLRHNKIKKVLAWGYR